MNIIDGALKEQYCRILTDAILESNLHIQRSNRTGVCFSPSRFREIRKSESVCRRRRNIRRFMRLYTKGLLN